MKFNPALFRDWFFGWEDLDHPVTILQRVWVLANLMEDDKRERDSEDYKLDMILAFIDRESFRDWQDLKAGKAISLPKEAQGEVEAPPLSEQFKDDIETLPMRRIGKPPLKDEYIASRNKKKTVPLNPEEAKKGWSIKRTIVKREPNA